jgi:transcriptional regulator with XRE-family HTH domain
MSAKRSSNGVSILHKRYVKDDPSKKAVLEQERVGAQVARMIRDLRERAGLSQKELADAIGTGQSAISRVEDADYEGHSLRMLQRVADALEQKLVVQLTTEDTAATGRVHFHQFVQQLRRRKGLTVSELARKTGIERAELAAMEQGSSTPEPMVLNCLSKFYVVPMQQMLRVAGVVRDRDTGFVEHASKFAAQSESFDKLTPEERTALDEFLAYLRTSG